MRSLLELTTQVAELLGHLQFPSLGRYRHKNRLKGITRDVWSSGGFGLVTF